MKRFDLYYLLVLKTVQKNTMLKLNLEQKIINALVIFGVLLAFTQFIYNRSLWLDEAMLALNIIHSNSQELLKPLTYRQAAPILFWS